MVLAAPVIPVAPAYRDPVLSTRLLARLALILLAGCTATTPVTTTSTSAPPAVSTTEANPCPDVSCVVFAIDPAATWSDGTPVTADDFVHTLELARAGGTGNPGYDLVTGHEVVDDKTLLVSFSETFGPLQTLFAVVLPAHDESAFSGADATDVAITQPDGVRGVVQGLRRGEVDVAWLADPPEWAVAEMRALEGVTVQVAPGPDWEMITFNQANPLLAERWLRQAIVYAVDREAMLDATVRTVDPAARALDSTMWMQGTAVDADPFPHAYDPAQARAILDENGCSPGDDGVRVCDGVRLSLAWVTTAGDAWREAQLDMGVEALASIGIEIVPRLLVPPDLFSEGTLFGEDWDIVSFAWTAQPDPYLSADLYRCHGDGPHGFGALNIGRHCGPGVDEKLDDAARTVDPSRRSGLYSEVDRVFLADAVVVPLYQRPVVIAHRGVLAGPAPGPFAGPFQRIEGWSGPEQVVLGVLVTPASPASLGPLDPVTDSMRRFQYRGAFRVGPDGEYAPDLVVRFDILTGR